MQKSSRFLKLPRVLLSFHNNKFLLRFFSDKVVLSVLSDRDPILTVLNDGLLRVPSDRLFFRVLSNKFFSLVIYCSFSSLVRYFLSTRATTFCLHYIIKKNFTQFSSEKLKKYLHDKDTKYYIQNMSSISQFIC